MIIFYHYINLCCKSYPLYLTPSIRQSPRGKGLERIKRSPNYKNGKFQNFSYTTCEKLRLMIYVFKTSVKTKKDIWQLSRFLSELLLPQKWNFDLQDCDKIFRIDSQTDIIKTIIDRFNNRGFKCEELQ